MSRIFDFNKRFGKIVDIEEVKKDFTNKVAHYLIEPLDERDGPYYSDYNCKLFNFVSLEFNCNPTDVIKNYNKRTYRLETIKPSFKIFSGGDFEKTLLLIEVFFDYFSDSGHNNKFDNQTWIKVINDTVVLSLNQPISLGISWRDGKFYPEGVEEFDEQLIVDVLKWLEKKPRFRGFFLRSHPSEGERLSQFGLEFNFSCFWFA